MSIAQRRVGRFLNQLADVYTQSPSGGRYTVLEQAQVPVRKMPLDSFRSSNGLDRSELSARQQICWDASYAPSTEFVQFEIAGARWQATRGSFQEITRRGPAVIFRQCEASRIEPRV